ncbi:hypothetical protein VULLAG_LOCUS4060 [Vulpes lagopus]
MCWCRKTDNHQVSKQINKIISAGDEGDENEIIWEEVLENVGFMPSMEPNMGLELTSLRSRPGQDQELDT